MPLKYRDLRNTATTSPPLEPLTGGQPAKKDRVMSAFAQTDRLMGHTRRIVGRCGLQGAEKFQVVSTNTSSLTQTYPMKGQERVAMRLKWRPTPGAMPTLTTLVVPSGATQRTNVLATYELDPSGGRLKVDVRFIGSVIKEASWYVDLPDSGEQYKGEKTDAAASWSALTRVDIPIMLPDDIKTAATMRTWSEMSSVEVTLSYINGCRVVDAVISETPFAYAQSTSDSGWFSSLSTDGSGKVVQNYPLNYPSTSKSLDDPSYGSEKLYSVTQMQQSNHGAMLMQFSSWCETTQPLGSSESASVSTSSTSWVDIIRPTFGEWRAAQPGWSLSAGGCSQQYRFSNAARVMRGVNSAVPVRLWVYGRCVGGSGYLRLQSERYSFTEMTVSTTLGWHSVAGVMHTGVGAEDFSVAGVFGRVDNPAHVLHVHHVVLEYFNQ